MLGGGGLDRYCALAHTHHLGKAGLHLGYVGTQLGGLSADGAVAVSELVTCLTHHLHDTAKQNLGINTLVLVALGVGEMIPDITHIGSAENGVAESVNQHIGI